MAVLLAIMASVALLQQSPSPSPAPTTSPSASPSPSPSPTPVSNVDPKAPKVTVVLGEPAEKWPVTGTAEVPDERALQVSARRMERHWDAVAETFSETVSDRMRKYGTGIVKGRAYKAEMKAGPTGFYKVLLVSKEDDMLLFESRLALGRADKLFTTSVEKVRKLVGIIEKSQGYLAEIIAVNKNEKPGTTAARQDFLDRVSAPEHALEELYNETDLTGVIDMMKTVYFHLRNAQVWNKGAAGSDGAYPDQGMFLNPDLSIGDMDKKIKTAAHVLSLELRLSIAGLVDDLYERAGTDAKKLGRVRDAGKEAVKLAAESPEKDEKFTKTIEKIQAAREEKEIAEVRAELQAFVDALFRRY